LLNVFTGFDVRESDVSGSQKGYPASYDRDQDQQVLQSELNWLELNWL
jgi:hypothetical protein